MLGISGIQGFFQALCHTTVFVFQIEFVKSAGGLQSAISPQIGPGQSPGGGPRDKAPESSTYLDFENLLL